MNNKKMIEFTRARGVFKLLNLSDHQSKRPKSYLIYSDRKQKVLNVQKMQPECFFI